MQNIVQTMHRTPLFGTKTFEDNKFFTGVMGDPTRWGVLVSWQERVTLKSICNSCDVTQPTRCPFHSLPVILKDLKEYSANIQPPQILRFNIKHYPASRTVVSVWNLYFWKWLMLIKDNSPFSHWISIVGRSSSRQKAISILVNGAFQSFMEPPEPFESSFRAAWSCRGVINGPIWLRNKQWLAFKIKRIPN